MDRSVLLDAKKLSQLLNLDAIYQLYMSVYENGKK